MIKLVIVGSGIGGSVLAHCLPKNAFSVTMVEQNFFSGQEIIMDKGIPAKTDPHIKYGYGGTTQCWHNGLIEISSEIFEKYWPYPKKNLEKCYSEAFKLLAGIDKEIVTKASQFLKHFYDKHKISTDNLKNYLYYPLRRINIFEYLYIEKNCEIIDGCLVDVDLIGPKISSITILNKDGNLKKLDVEVLILSMGGLNTPIFLQKIYQKYPIKALANAGKYYEDHPSCFIGSLKFKKPIHKFWNFPVFVSNKKHGYIRQPVIISFNNLEYSFQLRPSAHLKIIRPRELMGNILGDLRNKPFSIRNWYRFLTSVDDIFEVLSIKLGMNFPTCDYAIMMVCQQISTNNRSVYLSNGIVARNWDVGGNFNSEVKEAFEYAFKEFGDLDDISLNSDLKNLIFSSSHHSGTARMGAGDESVCDSDCRVKGISNLFVCDGSVIPASGAANTGLTIAALAIKLSEYLNKKSNV